MSTKPYPIQKGRPKTHRERKYPFYEMAVGSMFFVPGVKPNTMMSLASATGKRMSAHTAPEVFKFETRQLWMKLVDGKWVEVPAETKGALLGVAVYRTS